MPTLHERIEGGLIGLLVGDALGVPYEFHPPEALPPPDRIEMVPPPGFRRAHASVPPGTWSDDGAQALALLVSLLARDGLDLDDFGQGLLDWYEQGDMAVGGIVFDVGIQTSTALRRLAAGHPPATAGPADAQANGNGALMRVLPLALWHRGSDEALVEDAQRQGLVTHGHPRSGVCCALYCLWARRTLHTSPNPWGDAVATLRTLYGEGTRERGELERHIRPDDPAPGTGSGYVVDSLRSARWAVEQGGFEQVAKAAVALGHDTDTTACIAGGIAGIRDGVQGIPARWRTALRGMELVTPLLERLLARHEA